jgi:site-specific recombinase XerD
MKNQESIKIAKLVNSWLIDYAPSIKANSQNTIRSYEVTLAMYAKFLEDEVGVYPDSLTLKHFEKEYVEAWIRWLKTVRQNSNKTCNHRLSCLRAFLQYLASKEYAYNYLYIESCMVPRSKEPTVRVDSISLSGIKALLMTPNTKTKIGLRDLTLMAFMYDTAARVGEVLSIKVCDINLHGAKSFVRVIGKRSKVRTLYITPQLKTYLLAYIREYHDGDAFSTNFLFYSRILGKESPMTQEAVNKMLKKYAAMAHQRCPDVPSDIHCHMLRHSKATHWLDAGMNLLQISLLLGHANLNATMIYLDITTDQESKALSTLENKEQRRTKKMWRGKEATIAASWGIKDIK